MKDEESNLAFNNLVGISVFVCVCVRVEKMWGTKKRISVTTEQAKCAKCQRRRWSWQSGQPEWGLGVSIDLGTWRR